MRTKHLLAALALPLAFAACTNEELIPTEQAQAPVVGSKLVSKGMTLNVVGDPSTRMSEEGGVAKWDNGDKIGLGWFSTSATDIKTDQLASWADLSALTDFDIYANHLMTYNNGTFSTEGDIYEGGYFAYYPFLKLQGVKKLDVELAKEQTIADPVKTYLDGVFSISPIDTIKAKATQQEPVIKNFYMKAVANALRVNTSLLTADGFNAEDLAKIKITSVEVDLNNKAVFYTKATVQPTKLPKATYTTTDDAYDVDAAKTSMKDVTGLFGGDKGLKLDAAASALATTVKADMPINQSNSVILFTFPTDKSTIVAASDVTITVVVEIGKTKPATTASFEIKSTANPVAGTSEGINNVAIDKLVALLSTKGWLNASGESFKLSEMLTSRMGLNISLDVTKMKQAFGGINSPKKWNDAVAKADALKLSDATFTLTGDIAFTATDKPSFPANTALTIVGVHAMTIEGGNATINKSIEASTLSSILVKRGNELTLAKDATLTVGATAGIITNNGTFNVNGKIVGAAGATLVNVYENIAYPKAIINLGAEGQIKANITATNANGIINIAAGTKNDLALTASSEGTVNATFDATATAAQVSHVASIGANNIKLIGSVIKLTGTGLSKADVTLDGATLDGTAPGLTTIKSLTVDNATTQSTLKGIIGVTGKLIVKKGVFEFADKSSVTIDGTAEVKAEAALNINSGAIPAGTATTTITGKVSNDGIITIDNKSVVTFTAGNTTGAGETIVKAGSTLNK